MTREEAVSRLRKVAERNGYHGLPTDVFIDSLLALEVVKFEMSIPDTLLGDLKEVMVETAHRNEAYAGYLTQYGAGCIVEHLRNRGYKITK